jgi:protein-disulfide isomerase
MYKPAGGMELNDDSTVVICKFRYLVGASGGKYTYSGDQVKRDKIFVLGGLIVGFFVFGSLGLIIKKNLEKTEQPGNAPISNELLIRSHSFIKGNPDARVTLTEFLDPECESCRAMHRAVSDLLQEYEGKVRVVIRYMPFHHNSRLAIAALEEARDIGRYNEALDVAFELQPVWGSHSNPRPEVLLSAVEKLGVPKERLEPEYLLKKHETMIALDFVDGTKIGVRQTPTFYVNGIRVDQLGYKHLKEAIESALAEPIK